MNSKPTIYILGTGGAALGAIKAFNNNEVTVIGRNKDKLNLMDTL